MVAICKSCEVHESTAFIRHQYSKAMTDLAQVLLDKGLLDNLSVYETKRVLSAVRNGVGKEDISGHVQKLMDIMVDNQIT